MLACIRAGEAPGGGGIKAEPGIIGNIAQHKHTLPVLCGGFGQSRPDHTRRDALATVRDQHRDRCQPKRAEWCIHARKQDMANDFAALLRHQRDHRVAIGFQFLHQIGFGRSGKGFQMDATDGIRISGGGGPDQNFPAIQKTSETNTLTIMQVTMGK